MAHRFTNRLQAGQMLAQALMHYAGRPDVIVLGLPRGGVPVGLAVAQALKVPLDVLLVRKLGMPGHEEFAIGAVAGGGVRLLQADVVRALDISPRQIEELTRREVAEIARRETLYRAGRPPLALKGKTVILVDDGVATGSTMELAVQIVREAHAARLIVAVPVSPRDAASVLRRQADELVCLNLPSYFDAVGSWYEDFKQLSDDEVMRYLAQAASLPLVSHI